MYIKPSVWTRSASSPASDGGYFQEETFKSLAEASNYDLETKSCVNVGTSLDASVMEVNIQQRPVDIWAAVVADAHSGAL
jgi:hypothetical protein